MLGRGISLDLADIQSKLVTSQAGRILLRAELRFSRPLSNRSDSRCCVWRRALRFGTRRSGRGRTCCLRWKSIDERWLADVGFGGAGPLYPIKLQAGEIFRQGVWSFRIRIEGDQFVLESQEFDGWLDLYAFTREPQYPVDYELGNHYTSTHPHSPFLQNVIAQQNGLHSRLILRNRELTEVKPGEETIQTLSDDGAIITVLADRFGLHFPPETRFPIWS